MKLPANNHNPKDSGSIPGEKQTSRGYTIFTLWVNSKPNTFTFNVAKYTESTWQHALSLSTCFTEIRRVLITLLGMLIYNNIVVGFSYG